MEVALTFDMGGRVGDALAIVDWLIEHDVHATVFMTGAMADNPNTDAGRKVLSIIEAIPTERKLLVIFAQQDEPGGLAVIAFHPGLDLSSEVVKRLDAAK